MDEIIPNLFLGDYRDAKKVMFSNNWPKKNIVCVHEELRRHTTPQYFYPILDIGYVQGLGQVDVIGVKQDVLSAAMLTIHECLERGEKVLVHCHAGIERSPLTVASYLVKYGHANNIADAYEILMSKRPEVQDRTHWLMRQP